MPQLTLDQALQLARQHHDAGRLKEAEQLYRQVLAAAPNHPWALQSLGLLAQDTGHLDAAVDLLRRAIAQRGDVAEFHFHLAYALEDLKRLPEAAAAYEAGLRVDPNVAEAWNNLGNLLVNLGRLEDAQAACRKAIALNPQLAAPYNNLGNALKAMGWLDESIDAYREAIARDPNFTDAMTNLGSTLTHAGRFEEAGEVFQKLVERNPQSAQMLNYLGNVLTRLSRYEQAEQIFSRAMELSPASAELHNNLGNVLVDKGEFEKAREQFETATRMKQVYPNAHSNLGNVLVALGKHDEAVQAYDTALKQDPGAANVYTNLAGALKEQGRADEALHAYREAVRLNPDFPEMHSNLIYGMHFVHPIEPKKLFEEHLAWAQKFADPLAETVKPRAAAAAQSREKLRIGYVSGDLRNHPVGKFMLPIFEAHDRAQFEIVCYTDIAARDPLAERIRSLVDAFHVTAGQNQQQVAELIRQHGIDVLVDLSGHTAHNRLQVFAQRPAAVQVTYLGYPNTTGLSQIDYRLSDALADPPGEADTLHTEKLFRLPRTAWCYQPAPEAGDVSPLPARGAGHVTFGSFNALGKVNPWLIELWSRVLHAVPRSRLILKAPGLRSEPTRERIRGAFAARGIDPDRVEPIGTFVDQRDHFAAYGRIDIGLDTFPYHGTTTTCEAMWMGVPVITLAGNVHVSRVGVSLLNVVGLGELVARDADEYVRHASQLAGDLDRIATLRSSLRQRMRASPLMDAAGFTRRLEEAYRQMVRGAVGA